MARVAVVVRAGAAPLWWTGVLAAGLGLLVPGLTGRRIGVLAGAALFLIAAAAVGWTGFRRYAELAGTATRAARHDLLQDRAVTLRAWRRGHLWWLGAALLLAVGSSFVLPSAVGMLLAGAGVGLWWKADRIGRRESADGVLLWVRTDRLNARGGRPAGAAVPEYRTTGQGAGDAAPGGARRRAHA
ncbi:hypothetical protein ACFWIA_00475 [Streptomyces sp. NPDC127068]|uniref:hypothetical protein n=1 Tax=Streptomyces sp. NPDC127068 TaxID=3347127 RepID=UPI003652D7D6